MRRVVLAVSMVLSVMLSIGAVDASSQHSGRQDRPRATQERHAADRTASRSRSGTFLPKRAVNAPSRQNATALRLPASAFSPATIDPSFDRVESNAAADQDWFGQSSNGHSMTYEALQRVTGYYQKANWQPSGAADTAHFRYQGSTFTSTSTAQNAWNDGITTTKGSLPASAVSDCSSSAGMPCNEVAFVDTSTTTHYRYYYLQKNQCLAETEFDFSDALYNSVDTQLEQIGATVAGNAAAVLNSVCVPGGNPTPTTQPTNPPPTATPRPTNVPAAFKIVSVRIEKAGAQPDWNQVRPPLRQVKAGSKVRLATYVNVTSGNPGQSLDLHFNLKDGSRTVFNKTYTGTLDKTNPADTYRFRTPTDVQVTTGGSYVLAATISMGGRSARQTFSFQVLSPHAPTPPPARPVSFAFDGLAVTMNGRSGRSFPSGRALNIVATYTVRNLHNPVQGTITRSFLIPVGGTFKAGDANVDSIVVVNGLNRNTHSFTPTIKGPLHIKVGIQIGRNFRQKEVDITLT